MFGVVLWSDEDQDKAVIWCEDHGDLAFYRKPENHTRIQLDAGDWVQFDMTMDRHLRFAHNPNPICEALYPELADTLGAVAPAHASVQVSHDPQDRGSARIIPFSAARKPDLPARPGIAARGG